MDYSKVIERLQDADVILVGIGRELAFYREKEIKEMSWEKGLEYYQNLEKGILNEKIIEYLQIYKDLEKILKGKEYFILTTNIDGLIFYSDLDKEKIVAPCGDLRRLQCGDISHGIWGIEEKFCPVCQKEGHFNIVETIPYNEDGYKREWEIYKKWLQKTINKKILLLELGEGFEFPTVIRWPFEKIAFINQKAYFFRINEKFPQISFELKEKGEGVKENAKDFILSIKQERFPTSL